MPNLNVLSGGAAEGLVKALAADLNARTGLGLGGSFGAVGVMREMLLAGEPCDLLILSQALIDGLVQTGHALADSVRALGAVHAGVAVATGEPHPRVDSPESLREALAKASAIYCPNPQKATAGIHFYKVLTELGLTESHADRLRTYPNGNAAMRALASDRIPGAIASTQVTEIVYTPGVELVGLLPEPFGLSTVYTAAVSAQAQSPLAARALIELMTSAENAELRQRAGFS
ncbi:MAG: substrate-binding domain-containing protein [Alphaproteobacteria bacterium]|nr:substrate-binding domain-containing protein [Alphaproteobacteria bacterium]